jgi:hypothetical protein
MTLSAPGGRPASNAISASRTEVNGANSGGLRTIVLPAARAGPTVEANVINGEFHGVMMPMTPYGSSRV